MSNETTPKSRLNRKQEIDPDPVFVATVNKMLRTPPKGHDDMKAGKNGQSEKSKAKEGVLPGDR